MQEYLSQVTQIKYLTLHVLELSVRLTAPTDLAFSAGQYMQFKIAENVVRSYSIASPPRGDNPTLTFCIKLEPKGVGSDYVRTLKVGSDLLMRGPAGNFTIQDFNQPVFLVATGVGIAPYASIIPDMLSRGYRENSRLLFGVRSEENVFYYDKFNRLAQQYENFKFVPVMSRPQSHWPGETGYVTTYIEVSYQLFKDYIFYVCGTKQMVLDSRQALLKQGHDPNKIKLEIFS
jgi:ferredoxin-NADP reductase